jgi:hypothetical protein
VWYTFNNSGAVTQDFSGNSFHGTVSNGVLNWYAPGYVVFTNKPSITIPISCVATGGEGTVVLRMYTATTNALDVVWCQRYDGNNFVDLEFPNSATATWNAKGYKSGYQFLFQGPAIVTNQWIVHLVTWTTNNACAYYSTDGTNVTAFTRDTSVAAFRNPGTFVIGEDYPGASYAFNGGVDDFRYYTNWFDGASCTQAVLNCGQATP